MILFLSLFGNIDATAVYVHNFTCILLDARSAIKGITIKQKLRRLYVQIITVEFAHTNM